MRIRTEGTEDWAQDSSVFEKVVGGGGRGQEERWDGAGASRKEGLARYVRVAIWRQMEQRCFREK